MNNLSEDTQRGTERGKKIKGLSLKETGGYGILWAISIPHNIMVIKRVDSNSF